MEVIRLLDWGFYPISNCICSKELFTNYALRTLLDKLDIIERFENPSYELRVGEALEKQKKYMKLWISYLTPSGIWRESRLKFTFIWFIKRYFLYVLQTELLYCIVLTKGRFNDSRYQKNIGRNPDEETYHTSAGSSRFLEMLNYSER